MDGNVTIKVNTSKPNILIRAFHRLKMYLLAESYGSTFSKHVVDSVNVSFLCQDYRLNKLTGELEYTERKVVVPSEVINNAIRNFDVEYSKGSCKFEGGEFSFYVDRKYTVNGVVKISIETANNYCGVYARLLGFNKLRKALVD